MQCIASFNRLACRSDGFTKGKDKMMGRWLIILGALLILLGLGMVLLEKMGCFRLPGDIFIRGKNWSFYFPLATCLLLSLLLSGLLWLIHYFRKH